MAMVGKRATGRVGNVVGRSQVKDPKTGLWVKRDTASGRFVSKSTRSEPSGDRRKRD